MVVSEIEIQELYYNQQLSLAEVGKILKVTPTQVHWYMNKYGMPRRTKSEANTKLDIPKEELERLYLVEKYSAGEIAQKYNTFTVTITRKLKNITSHLDHYQNLGYSGAIENTMAHHQL
jgi:hypothetical protein